MTRDTAALWEEDTAVQITQLHVPALVACDHWPHAMFVTCGNKIRILYLHDMSRHAWLSFEGLQAWNGLELSGFAQEQ